MAAVRSRVPATFDVPSPPVGALLAWAVGATQARAVVEVGAAAGMTGLWLLRGMPARSMLTSIEADRELHRLATEAFEEARAGGRVRAINGPPAEVLPRLADGAYDIVLVQSPSDLDVVSSAEVRRLLRPGGTLIARGIGDTPGRAFVQSLIEDETFDVAVLPLDSGVALARSLAEGAPTHG